VTALAGSVDAVPHRHGWLGTPSHEAGRREFIAIVTSMMAMGALGIDLMLPTFPDMRAEFGMAADSSDVVWVITAFFLGMAVGPWLYGPISDRFGRRRPLFAGIVLYIAAAVVAAIAPSFGWIVASRFVWGLGAAAPRSLSLAMIRDRFDGNVMARLMSMIMAVFLLVPIVAPSFGSALNAIAPWRIVFWVPAIAASALLVWAIRRLPETLTPERQRPFTRAALIDAGKAVVTNRQTVCFTLAITFLFGLMTGYLASSELILDDVYGYGAWFPLFFGCVAVLLAASALNNARLVGRLGITRLIRRTSFVLLAATTLFLTVALVSDGEPPFWLFAITIALLMPVAQGMIPNCNTAAMMPVPHVAGTAAAIIGTVTTAGGSLLGSAVSSAFDGTIRPFAIGVSIYIAIAMALILFGATSRGPANDETVHAELPLLVD
jgi:MFS transporter, DHA1 family, multidrug resistance protein